MSDSADHLRTTVEQCRGTFTCIADYLERTAEASLFGRFRPAKPEERVYFIGSDDGPVKIGVTVNPQQRLESLQTGNPVPLKLLAVAPAGRSLERAYHRYWSAHRIGGEWFEPTDDMRREISFWAGRGWKLVNCPSAQAEQNGATRHTATHRGHNPGHTPCGC